MCAEKARGTEDRRKRREPLDDRTEPAAKRGRGRGRPSDDEPPDYEEMDAETALVIRRDRMTWREWFVYDFMRYWYWVGALALAAFSLMQVSWTYHVRDAAGLSGLAIAGILMVALEFYAYRVIWPEGIFTRGWPAGRRLRKAIRRLRWRL